MISKVYALFDKKAGIYYQPMFTPYEPKDQVEMIRRAVLSGSVQNYEDLELYSLGLYDDKTGIVTSLDKPQFIIYLGEFQNGKQENVIIEQKA